MSACALALIAGLCQPALASDTDQLQLLRSQLEQLQKEIEVLEQKQAELEQKQAAQEQKQAEQQQAQAQQLQEQSTQAEQSRAIQVYGQARVSLDSRSGNGWGTNDGTELVSNASRIGVKGEMNTNLADTDVFYLMEVRYETADYVNGGPGSAGDPVDPAAQISKQLEFREGFGGLKGGWGSLRLGRLQTEYKKTMTTIDPWNDNVPEADKGGLQGASEIHAGYANNAMDYVTPQYFGALRFNGWYATRFDASDKPIDNTSNLKNMVGGQMWGLGGKWKSGPLFLAADYIKIDAETINDINLSNGNGWQIAARYSGFGPLSMAAMYEDVEDIGLGRNIMANAIYTIGHYHVIGTYGQNRDGRVYGNDDWNNTSLGLKYDLTKSSELLAAWNHNWNDTDSLDYDTLTMGINAKFGY